MIDTYYYIDQTTRHIRNSNGDSNDNLFYLDGSNHIQGPKNSGHFWLDGTQFIGDNGNTGFVLQANGKIYGPSTHLPWLQ